MPFLSSRWRRQCGRSSSSSRRRRHQGLYSKAASQLQFGGRYEGTAAKGAGGDGGRDTETPLLEVKEDVMDIKEDRITVSTSGCGVVAWCWWW
jgi:hypothetical protein